VGLYSEWRTQVVNICNVRMKECYVGVTAFVGVPHLNMGQPTTVLTRDFPFIFHSLSWQVVG
jgi:hypothetical protein